MHTRAHLFIVSGLMLTIVGLVGGCPDSGRTEASKRTTPGVSPASDPAVLSAEDLFVELTYPQSDDQGNYVGVTESGSTVIAGLVSSPEPIDMIIVNGAETTPYVVEQILTYGAPEELPVYRFEAPVVLQPEDPIVLEFVRLDESVPYTFEPNRKAVTDRWLTIAEESPADPWVQHRLGSTYYAQGAYDDASRRFNQALETEQKLPWTLYDLGMTYLALDRADEAVNYFTQASTAYPAFPDAYYARGLANYQSGLMGDAALDLVKATSLVPNWAEPLLALGLTYYAQQELGQAGDSYSQAIDLWPTWAAPHYTLGSLWLDQGRDDDGYAMIDRGARLGPWGKGHHLQLAEKLAAKGNYNAAWRQLQIAEKLGETGEAVLVQRVRSNVPDAQHIEEWPWQPRVAGRDRIPDSHGWHAADLGPAAAVKVHGGGDKPDRASGNKGNKGDDKPDRASGANGNKGDDKPDRASGASRNKGDDKPDRASGASGNKGDDKPDRASGASGNKGGDKPDRASGASGNKGDDKPDRAGGASGNKGDDKPDRASGGSGNKGGDKPDRASGGSGNKGGGNSGNSGGGNSSKGR